MKTLSRRRLFGLQRARSTEVKPGFSLEDFYDRRKKSGADRAPVPKTSPDPNLAHARRRKP